MKKNNLTKNLIAGTVAAGLVFASFAGIPTLSADTASDTTSGASVTQKIKWNKGLNMPGVRQDVLDALQKEGVLTADQIKTINDKMEAAAKEDRTSKLAEQLAALVEKGTITQEQSTKITAFFAEKDKERQAEMDKVKAMTTEEREAYFKKQQEERQAERDKVSKMTETERKAYFEQKQSEKKSIMTEMVEAGIITQAQADELKKLIPQDKGHMGKGGMRPDVQNSNTNTTVQ